MLATLPPAEDLEALIRKFRNSDALQLHIRCSEVEIFLSKSPGQNSSSLRVIDDPRGITRTKSRNARSQPPAPSTPVKVDSDAPSLSANMFYVRAPYMGTFYRAAKPGLPPFVEVNQSVEADTELCLIEVMKLFTAVRAGRRGRIHSVLAQDGELIAADRPLFILEML